MTFAIYYRASDGEIMGWTTSHDPVAPDGMSLVAFDEPFDPPPDPLREKVAGGTVVMKSAAEQRAARMPTPFEVKSAVFAELRRTDQFMVSDYPIDDDERDGWKAYRKMLRGLSELKEAADMIDAWAPPPDGGDDPITALRERL